MTIAPGVRLGPYEVTAKLGEGGMGEVWRATDPKLKRDVAIKVLPEAFAADADRLARFEREAQLLAQLQHPNIASIYGLEESDGIRALVMELAPGEDLAERLKRGPLAVDEALAVARQIAEALEEAHEKGIVHRDLKPQNVKLTPEGKVKVLDFGLAKAMDPADGAASAADPARSPTQMNSPTLTAAHGTQLGVVLGTAAYMAPEQARGVAVDKRADIWGFGVVLYEMLTGRRLFEGELVTDVLANVLKTEIDFATLPPDTPPAIRLLLRRCLERQPRSRLHDIADARLVIEDVLAGRGDAEAVAAARPPVRSPWPLVAAALVLGALATVGAYRLLGGAEATPPAPPLAATIRLDAGLFPVYIARPLALSPDGNRLVVSAAMAVDGTRFSLYLRSLDRLSLVPLAGTDRGVFPFWSPDGRAIGFFADDKLKRIDLGSGVVRTLCDAPAGSGGTWSPRGTIAFAPAATGPLFEVSAEGGEPVELTRLAREGEGHRLPHYLPDGRTVLFWAEGRGAPAEEAVYAFDPDRGEPRKILDSATEAHYVAPGLLAFLADGNLMLQPFDAERLALTGSPRPMAAGVSHDAGNHCLNVAFSLSGRLVFVAEWQPPRWEMVWVDEAGDETPAWREPLTGLWSAASVSPDGRRAILVSRDGNNEERTELLDLEGGSRARIGPKGLLAAAPLWSRDGERIVVDAEVDGQRQLAWLRPLPDEPLHPLTSGPGMRHTPGGFTPDGRSVLFAQFSKLDTIGDLLVTDLDGGTPPRPFLAGPANERSPRLSPDGRWVAYGSDASGEMDLWITDFPATGARLQIRAWRKGFEFQVGWLSADEIWWRDSERKHLVAAKIRQRGAAIEIAGRRELLGGRTLAPANQTFGEGVFDYSPARRSFLLGRDVEPLLPPDLILVSDWRAALDEGEAKR